MLTVLLIAFAAFTASFIQRVTGFGYGIVFMTVAPYLLPSYGEATAVSGMSAIVCGLCTGVALFRYVPWKKLIPILLTFLAVSFFAVKLVSVVDSRMLKHFLGFALVGVSIYFIFISGRFTMKPTLPVQMGMGTVSGMMGGLFGMQGPPAVIYFISCTDSKEEYMAITQWYFIMGNSFMTLYRAGNGFVTPAAVKAACIAVPAVLLGLLLGSKVYRRMPVRTVRKFVYVFIGIAGIIAIFA